MNIMKVIRFLPVLLIFFIIPSIEGKVYIPNETANFIVSVSDWKGNPIENATCVGYVFDPDMNIVYTLNLTYDPTAKVYYKNFTVPNKYGTYYQLAKCEFNLYGMIPMVVYKRSSFYVSSAFDVIEQRLREISENVSIQVTANITGNISQAIEQSTDDLMNLLIALHSTPVTQQYCLDNHTLIQIKTATWQINKKIYNITKNETINCMWGCDPKTNECRPNIVLQYAWAIGVVVVLIFIGFFALYLK